MWHGPFCALCGRLILKGRATLDHRHPIRHGGSNALANLDLAQGLCNEEKGAQVLDSPTGTANPDGTLSIVSERSRGVMLIHQAVPQ